MRTTCPLVPILCPYTPRDYCLILTGVLTGVGFDGSVAQFLGAFGKWRKATISFVMSVCLSVCPSA